MKIIIVASSRLFILMHNLVCIVSISTKSVVSFTASKDLQVS